MNPVFTTELRFLLRILFNLAVGYLVANGYMDPGVKDEVVIQLVEMTGYLITAITAAISLFGLFKSASHINHKIEPVMVEKSIKTTTTTPVTQVIEESGLPPVTVTTTEQKESTKQVETPLSNGN